MKKFHSLIVSAKHQETRDSVRISLDVPEDLRAEYSFQAGQHLPIQIERDGKKLRRTYSICSEPGEWPLTIGVRVQPGGQFSEFAANELKVGDLLDVMPPNGQFHALPVADNKKHYLGLCEVAAAHFRRAQAAAGVQLRLHQEPVREALPVDALMTEGLDRANAG